MHEDHLMQTLTLAKKVRGYCAPNPCVGAVLVKNNNVISTGYHEGPGSPHAERMCLSQVLAGKDAVLYSSLEPCCHFGRTPPCTDLIIEKKIGEVIYAFEDPNPLVKGQGREKLLNAGIDCHQVPLQSFNDFYQSYEHWHKTQMPFVTAKLAISLDGCIAKNHTRAALTGEQMNQFTHEMRNEADAILTTAQTILSDDPLLNVRLADKVIQKPVYVLDRCRRLKNGYKIFNSAKSLTVFHAPALEKNENGRAICVDSDGQHLSLLQVLKEIGHDGIHDLWVEAGGRLFLQLIMGQYVQRAFLAIAPIWMGRQGNSAFQLDHQSIFKDAKYMNWSQVGNDGLLELRW